MQYYDGAHEYLHSVKDKGILDQVLYLVPEVNNTHDINAVMLHNGQRKIGSVSAQDAGKLKRLMTEWKQDNGPKGEDVIVVKVDYIYEDLETFKHRGSIKVRALYRVNERLARKFSNLKLKK